MPGRRKEHLQAADPEGPSGDLAGTQRSHFQRSSNGHIKLDANLVKLPSFIKCSFGTVHLSLPCTCQDMLAATKPSPMSLFCSLASDGMIASCHYD